MTVQMTLPTDLTHAAAGQVVRPLPLMTAACSGMAEIDRDTSEMLGRALGVDHLLEQFAEIGYLEAQARALAEAARSTCLVRVVAG